MWHRDAQKALETDVFLKLFAKERNITITDEQLKEEIEKIKKSNPKGDQTVYENPQWIEYIRRVIVKQKAFEVFMKELMPKKK
jgi:FKBP-type peptidyl-prolyl cis-trans isomerase (trigger factor)